MTRPIPHRPTPGQPLPRRGRRGAGRIGLEPLERRLACAGLTVALAAPPAEAAATPQVAAVVASRPTPTGGATFRIAFDRPLSVLGVGTGDFEVDPIGPVGSGAGALISTDEALDPADPTHHSLLLTIGTPLDEGSYRVVLRGSNALGGAPTGDAADRPVFDFAVTPDDGATPTPKAAPVPATVAVATVPVVAVAATTATPTPAATSPATFARFSIERFGRYHVQLSAGDATGLIVRDDPWGGDPGVGPRPVDADGEDYYLTPGDYRVVGSGRTSLGGSVSLTVAAIAGADESLGPGGVGQAPAGVAWTLVTGGASEAAGSVGRTGRAVEPARAESSGSFSLSTFNQLPVGSARLKAEEPAPGAGAASASATALAVHGAIFLNQGPSPATKSGRTHPGAARVVGPDRLPVPPEAVESRPQVAPTDPNPSVPASVEPTAAVEPTPTLPPAAGGDSSATTSTTLPAEPAVASEAASAEMEVRDTPAPAGTRVLAGLASPMIAAIAGCVAIRQVRGPKPGLALARALLDPAARWTGPGPRGRWPRRREFPF